MVRTSSIGEEDVGHIVLTQTLENATRTRKLLPAASIIQ